jgi:asparagine synthase (glutamine-hydrolysing)
MSTIFGVMTLDGQPVTEAMLHGMAEPLKRQGPDGRGLWCGPGVALGHLMLHLTPESLHEKLPATPAPYLPHADELDLVITADVRLDNRQDLCSQLGIPGTLCQGIPDSQLILAAYRCWGPLCPTRLLGDFAFAIWDTRQRTLFCARDPMGIRPFHFFRSSRLFIFASDIRGVMAHAATPRSFNDPAIAIYLTVGHLCHQEWTFRAAVNKLPPGHSLLVRQSGEVVRRRYWSPEQAPSVHFKTTDGYVEALRALLQEAVHARLRTSFPIGAHLSGGLDSSSVAVLASRALQGQGRTLPTFTWTPPPSSPADLQEPEWANLHTVCAAAHLSTEHVDLTADFLARMFLQDVGLHHEGGPLYEPLVRQAASRHGVRLLLSGWGGDELISFSGRGYLADLLWRGHWGLVARGLAEQMSGIATWRERLRVAYRSLVLPSLPSQLAARLGKRPASVDYTIALSTAFAAYVKQQAGSRRAPWSVRPSVRAAQIALLDNGHLPLRIEQCATAGADDHIVYVYPLLDRRIVEFALGVPPHLYARERHGRYLFRRTLRGILPDAVRWSHVKQEPRRVERLIDLTQTAVDHARQWLDRLGLLGVPNTYVDVSRLIDLQPLNGGDWMARLPYCAAMHRSIQLMALGQGWAWHSVPL